MTSYADQRIETIKQQVMSRTTLWKIVDQDRLYEPCGGKLDRGCH